MLEVVGLNFQYASKPVLNNIGFSINRGEFTVLLGQNGAGKTTLFSLITHLFATRSGRIRIDGIALAENSVGALARMGVVFQHPTLDLELTVRENLLYHGALHGMGRRRASRRMEEELARVGAEKTRDERVRNLSGGYRRRVEIARALLHQPKFLLLDEPTVGLDVPTRRDIVDHVHDLAADKGVSVLWASHLIDEIRDSDKLLILHKGKLRAQGSVGDVVAAAGAKDVNAAFEMYLAREPA